MSKFAKSFKELDIWKLAVEVAKTTYKLTDQLPQEEKYGLVSQMRRAAVSLSANIAEGFRRGGQKEFRQFLHIALGSAGELETYCELCRVLFDGHAPDSMQLREQVELFQRMTNAMIGTLRRRSA